MKAHKVSQHFDEIAHDYDTTIPAHVRDHYLHRRLELVREQARKGYKILEVGCGTGLLATELVRDGYIVFGLDVSWEMLKIAEDRCLASFVGGEGSRLPFPSNFFDLTLCVATLHHIADPSLVCDCIQEMTRVTQPDGHVIIIDHNPLNPYWPLLMKKVPQDCGDERLIPLSEVLDNLKIAGIRRVQWQRTGFTPDFMPARLLPLWKIIERGVEKTPGLKLLCAHNVIVSQK